MATGGGWWVIAKKQSAVNPGRVTYVPQQASTKPQLAVAGPFKTMTAAQNWIQQKTNAPPLRSPIPNPITAAGNTAKGWLSGLGGQIGSGIEQALVSGLTDLFDVIIGPLEIAVGFMFILWAFMLFFKDDIMNGIRLLGGLAISGAAMAA